MSTTKSAARRTPKVLAGFAAYYENHGVGKSVKDVIKEYTASTPKQERSEDTKKKMGVWRGTVKEHYDKKKLEDDTYTWKQALKDMSKKKTK